MNRRVTTAIVSFAAIAALGANACSKDASSTSAGAGPTTTVASNSVGVSPTTASGQPAGNASNDVCKLLTTTEAATLVPGVSDGQPGTAGGGAAMCKYVGADKSSLTVQLDNGKWYYAGDAMGASTSVTVPGVGDKNALDNTGRTFAILKGDKALLVTTLATGATATSITDAQRLAAAKTLMATISNRM